MSDTPSVPREAPPKFELTEADDYGKYLLYSKTEIVFILRALQKKGSLISVYFNQGNDFLLTSVLAVDDSGITLDLGSDAQTNRKALASAKLIFVSSHERVKIQFSTTQLVEARHEGRPAFRTPLPESLLRLQRREYYRLTTPIANPLKCLVPVPREDGSQRTVEVNVMDISGGGVAVVVPPEGVPFAPDMRFENCRIDLPEAGTVTATLEVRNVFEVTLRSGTRVRRAGCRFLHLPGPMASMIQRYIIKVERQRKAKE
jgi:c-di-GMP-binding flagellar brake protein YcgR